MLLFFLLCACFAFGQQNPVDSLIQLLPAAKEDTNKVNLLFNITELCEEPDILTYAEPALKLAEELDYKKGMANVLNNIAYVYDHKGNSIKALELYQRSLAINLEINNTAGAANCYYFMGDIYQSQGNFKDALDLYQKSLTIREQNKDRQGIARTLNQMAIIYSGLNNFKIALEYFKKS
ncbi:MAG: tetratricopeptide repeat protein, partial [Bacteroidia bacterium]